MQIIERRVEVNRSTKKKDLNEKSHIERKKKGGEKNEWVTN